MLRSSYKVATVMGIPIKIHISLILMVPLMLLEFGWLWGLPVAVGLVVSIVLHELGHSVVAMAKGCRVREIHLLILGGAAQMESIPRRPRDEILMALAGPAVSLVLGVLGTVAGALVSLPIVKAGVNYLQWLGIINLGLLFFNLLPAFPMDGGRVLRAALAAKFGRLRATSIAVKVGKTLAVLFGLSQIFMPRPSFILIGIAFFIFIAAENEYRIVQMQEAAKRNPFGAWGAPDPSDHADDDSVTISPPPYADGPASKTDIKHDSRGNPFGRLR